MGQMLCQVVIFIFSQKTKSNRNAGNLWSPCAGSSAERYCPKFAGDTHNTHFGPTEPLCRQNVDIRAGITAVIGIGDGCEKGVPSLCQGVPGVPGRLIAGKLVTNVSTGGGGTGTHRSPLSRGTPTLLCPGG